MVLMILSINHREMSVKETENQSAGILMINCFIQLFKHKYANFNGFIVSNVDTARFSSLL